MMNPQSSVFGIQSTAGAVPVRNEKGMKLLVYFWLLSLPELCFIKRMKFGASKEGIF